MARLKLDSRKFPFINEKRLEELQREIEMEDRIIAREREKRQIAQRKETNKVVPIVVFLFIVLVTRVSTNSSGLIVTFLGYLVRCFWKARIVAAVKVDIEKNGPPR